MQFVPLAAAIALIWKVVDFAKLVRVRDVNAIVTQVATWAAGVGVMFLLAATDFASGIRVGGLVLAHLDGAALVLVGLSFGSSASVAYDLKRAIDRSDSAAMPTLLPVAPPAAASPEPPPEPVLHPRTRRPRSR